MLGQLVEMQCKWEDGPQEFIPVRHLAPLLLISDHVYDLPRDFVVGLAALLARRQVHHDKSSSLDPYRVPEPLRELDEGGLGVRQDAGVRVVALGLPNARDKLVLGQLVGRSGRLGGCCQDVALGTTHCCVNLLLEEEWTICL